MINAFDAAGDVVRYLLEHGADPLAMDAAGWTGAAHALAFDHVSVLRANSFTVVMAARMGRDTSSSPLHIVARWGSLGAWHWLLENVCASPGYPNPLGRPDAATGPGLTRPVAGPSMSQSPSLMTIEDNSTESIGVESGGMCEEQAVVAMVRHISVDGVTPLHLAARYGHAAMCRALVDMGADPKARDAVGHSCIDVAHIWGRSEIVSFLNSLVGATMP